MSMVTLETPVEQLTQALQRMQPQTITETQRLGLQALYALLRAFLALAN